MSTDEEGTAHSSVTRTTRAFTCPACGWVGEFDDRFTPWCESCGFNAEPLPQKALKPRVERRRARKRARKEKACEELASAPDLRPRSAAGVAVVIAATIVHLMTLCVFAVSVYVVARMHGFWFEPVLGVLGIGVSIAVRPRIWRELRTPRAINEAVTRAKAPALFALLDRCAAQLGAKTPDYVLPSGRFNASTSNVGLKRKNVVMLGIPLWELLSGQERIALMGHELGHQVNGDLSRGALVRSARRSIAEWMTILFPGRSARRLRRRKRDFGPLARAAEFAQPVCIAALFGPALLVVLGCHAVLDRLDSSTRNRAEYLADEMGARLGSTAGKIGVLERLTLRESVSYFIQRQRSARFTGALWPALHEYLDSVPEHERRRRLWLDTAHGASVDSTHPANYLRRRLLAARPQHTATVTADETEWAAIDAELAPYRALVARSLLGVSARSGRKDRAAGQDGDAGTVVGDDTRRVPVQSRLSS